MTQERRCPFGHGAATPATGGRSNRDWWPNQLDLKILHQHTPESSPMPAGCITSTTACWPGAWCGRPAF